MFTKLRACLLLVLLVAPQALRAQSLVVPSGDSELLPQQHSQTLSRQHARRVLTMSQTILFAGDSIMEGMGPVLADMLSPRDGLVFVQAGRSATGLCRPDVFDWPRAMRDYMRVHRPRLVVMCIGANDDQPVSHGGLRHMFDTPGWEQAYAAKVHEIMDIVAEGGGISLWVSPPIMGPQALRARVYAVKEVIHRACQSRRAAFIDVWTTLADSHGNFQEALVTPEGKAKTLRTKDGVHVTPAGNALLGETIVPQVLTLLARDGATEVCP